LTKSSGFKRRENKIKSIMLDKIMKYNCKENCDMGFYITTVRHNSFKESNNYKKLNIYTSESNSEFKNSYFKYNKDFFSRLERGIDFFKKTANDRDNYTYSHQLSKEDHNSLVTKYSIPHSFSGYSSEEEDETMLHCHPKTFDEEKISSTDTDECSNAVRIDKVIKNEIRVNGVIYEHDIDNLSDEQKRNIRLLIDIGFIRWGAFSIYKNDRVLLKKPCAHALGDWIINRGTWFTNDVGSREMRITRVGIHDLNDYEFDMNA
jgi:hypothetical protein